MEEKIVVVYTANGKLEAESIRIFLESFGIKAGLSGESVASVYGFTAGPLSEVQVLVPESQEEEARSLLARMENGDFVRDENDEDLEEGPILDDEGDHEVS